MLHVILGTRSRYLPDGSLGGSVKTINGSATVNVQSGYGGVVIANISGGKVTSGTVVDLGIVIYMHLQLSSLKEEKPMGNWLLPYQVVEVSPVICTNHIDVGVRGMLLRWLN